ncbi:probable E3 ubiquitin-protein ligase RNF144A-A [Protopterus annectens]|uniref:probable E3 ubiquitin-protein ligase RNF144A-A n=1 Tax=Protopterus annectens TaxID=7888 RepID=UPI001CFA1CAD|nr:probable E3 ubiquitin-protein ligase RNF144A-A [Protopterus annectens]
MTTEQSIPEKRYDPNDKTLKFVKRKDEITGDDDPNILRAEMSCGHAVDPNSLTAWCRSLIDQNHYKFHCPAVQDGTTEKCRKEWPYQEVRKLAVLSSEEQQYFEEHLAALAAAEYCEYKSCPGCYSFVERKDLTNLNVRCLICTAQLGKTFEFCWQCRNEWKGPGPRTDRCENTGCMNRDLETLKTCKLINLAGTAVNDCPSIRACPTCGQLIEHDQTGCKNIRCSRCQKEFCFACLELTQVCQATRPGAYYGACAKPVAPKQTSIPTWNRHA